MLGARSRCPLPMQYRLSSTRSPTVLSLSFAGTDLPRARIPSLWLCGGLGKMPFKHLAMYPWQEGMPIFTAKHFSWNTNMDSFATAHEVIKHGRVKSIVCMGTIRDQHLSCNHCQGRYLQSMSSHRSPTKRKGSALPFSGSKSKLVVVNAS